MRGPFVILLLALFVPSSASAVATCVDDACVEVHAWSARDGSCGGAGSERNVVTASAPDAQVRLETFCVRAGDQSYREVSAQVVVLGTSADAGWTSTQGACSLFVMAGSARVERPCSGATPPAVPALLA